MRLIRVPGIADRAAIKKHAVPICSLLAAIFLLACASGRYQVPDAEFFTDGYALDKQTLQVVESHEDASLLLPAAERYARNCESAEVKARNRHRVAYPQSRDEGKKLSTRFDKNAGCTVRMAFRKE